MSCREVVEERLPKGSRARTMACRLTRKFSLALRRNHRVSGRVLLLVLALSPGLGVLGNKAWALEPEPKL